jgi:ABC-type multidrug transport system permease subunit
MKKNITGVILLILMITLGIYDFYAYVIGGNYSTISRVMRNSSIESPAIILVIGYLLGHFFSPLQKDQ